MNAQYPYLHNDRREVLPFVSPAARSVLEVGCGSGAFGSLLRQLPEVDRLVGVEPDQDAAAAAGVYFDEVLCGEYPEVLAGRDELFDCVVFNDVLEHLVDPWGVLEATKARLTAGGTLVASIPNARVLNVSGRLLVHGDWHYESQGVLDRTHLRFFTRLSLTRMFEEAGYVVTSVAPINPFPKTGRAHRLAARWGSRLPRQAADLLHDQFAVVAAVVR